MLPASAGMILVGTTASQLGMSAPRIGGNDPGGKEGRSPVLLCSLHLRG